MALMRKDRIFRHTVEVGEAARKRGLRYRSHAGDGTSEQDALDCIFSGELVLQAFMDRSSGSSTGRGQAPRRETPCHIEAGTVDAPGVAATVPCLQSNILR